MGTVVILIAGGSATRWNKYTGVDKHFIEIGGERLLERTIRQLNERHLVPFVAAKTDEYNLEGSVLFQPEEAPTRWRDASKFLDSQELWNKDGRTLVLYGDCYFTDEAMDTIIDHPKREWRLFGCFDKGECFAQSFYDEHIEEHLEALNAVWRQTARKRVGGWEHYRQMEGFPLDEEKVGDRFYEIDDLTNDFDFPRDYDEFMAAYSSQK